MLYWQENTHFRKALFAEEQKSMLARAKQSTSAKQFQFISQKPFHTSRQQHTHTKQEILFKPLPEREVCVGYRQCKCAATKALSRQESLHMKAPLPPGKENTICSWHSKVTTEFHQVCTRNKNGEGKHK